MTVSVLMLSPGFPEDLSYFTQGLAEVGARVYGIGDQPLGALRPAVRASPTDFQLTLSGFTRRSFSSPGVGGSFREVPFRPAPRRALAALVRRKSPLSWSTNQSRPGRSVRVFFASRVPCSW